MEFVAVVPGGAEIGLLDDLGVPVAAGHPEAARAGLLTVGERGVSYVHELQRRAVEAAGLGRGVARRPRRCARRRHAVGWGLTPHQPRRNHVSLANHYQANSASDSRSLGAARTSSLRVPQSSICFQIEFASTSHLRGMMAIRAK